MYNNILKYDSPPDETSGKKFAAIFSVLPVTLFLSYFVYKVIIWVDFKKLFDDGQYIMLSVYLFGAVMFLLGFYAGWRTVLELLINCYTIELHENRVVGFTAFNKRKEMKYEDIYYIIKQKGDKDFQSMRFQNKEGKTKIIVHWGINSYGECVDNIRKRAINLKVVDYGGVDKNLEVWEKSDKSYDS